MAHAQAPRRTIGSWEILEVVGSGSFAIVWKARHTTTGTLAAVKEILSDRLSKKLHESLESEIAVLQKLKHVNIVGLLDLYKEPGKIFLVLEYCAGGDLAQHLRQRGPLSEASCRYLLRHLAEGLKVLRQHNVIHRDLKPQNLLLSDHGPSPALKIADFGFARSLQPAGLAETLCGSPLYMAPEVLQLHRYDAKADLWSVGTILFELLTGKPPFNGANHLQLIQNIERGDAVLPDNIARGLSPACRQLLQQLLRRNPVERISFDELFVHPFLTGLDPSTTAAAGSATTPLLLSPPLSGVGSGSSGASAAADPHHQQLQRRHAPTSQGAVRFVQPLRVGGPVHPALAVPPPASSPSAAAAGIQQPPPPSSQQQQQLPSGAAPGPGSDPAAAAAAAGGPIAAISVRELTRSPSPRLIAAAAAVASAFQADGTSAVATVAAPGPVLARHAAGGGSDGGAVAATGVPGRGGGSSSSRSAAAGGLASAGSAPLADSLDSDYVVVSSPCITSRPSAPAPLSPRTPHPAMIACGGGGGGSGKSSRNGSAGGAPPPPPSAAEATSGGAAAAAPQQQTSWQQLLSPIAAATLPPWSQAGAVVGAGLQKNPKELFPVAAAVARPIPNPTAAAATAGATTVTIRVPPPGACTADGDVGGDPLLLPRVVGVLLDHARSRCTAILDQEAEVRQLGETHAAAAAVAAASAGSSFAAGQATAPGFSGATHGGYGGHGAIAGTTGPGQGAGAGPAGGHNLADEAAAAVGTFLVACRLLVAALSSSTASAVTAASDPASADGGGRQGSGGGAGDAGLPAADAGGKAAADTTSQQSSGGGGPGGGAGPSLAALAALAVHARSLLAALDEHLHGAVARLLLTNGGDGCGAAARPRETAGAVAAAAPAPLPVVPCSLDALLAAAVHHGRAAAGEEMMGNTAGAADQYGRAADVLHFLLAAPEPQQQQQQQQSRAAVDGQKALPEAVLPPLGPHDRQRLTKYYAAVRLRQSAVMSAMGPTAAVAAVAATAAARHHLHLHRHPTYSQPAHHHLYQLLYPLSQEQQQQHLHNHLRNAPHPRHDPQLQHPRDPRGTQDPSLQLDFPHNHHHHRHGPGAAQTAHGSEAAAAGPYAHVRQPGCGAIVF